MLMTLKVPEDLYLPAVQWLAEQTRRTEDVAMQATMSALSATNTQLSSVVDKLQTQLDSELQENWALRERIKIEAEHHARLRSEMDMLRATVEAQAELFDTDDSYPDHGEDDDRAAAMGLPSLTAGTLVEVVRKEARREAMLDVTDPLDPVLAAIVVAEPEGRHEAPEPPAAVPSPAPAPEPAAAPEEPVTEAAEPPAPLPEPAPARQLSRPLTEREAAIEMFLDDMLQPAEPDQFVTAREVTDAYEAWRGAIGAPPVDQRQMGIHIARRGVTRKQPSRAVAALFGGSRPMLYLATALKGSLVHVLPTKAERAADSDQPGKELADANIRDLVKEVIALHPDWVYKRAGSNGRGKPRLVGPGGRRVLLPKTPSDHRVVLNTRASLRRAGAAV